MVMTVALLLPADKPFFIAAAIMLVCFYAAYGFFSSVIAGRINAYVVTKTTMAATEDTIRVKNFRVLRSFKICLILRSKACILSCPSDIPNDAESVDV